MKRYQFIVYALMSVLSAACVQDLAPTEVAVPVAGSWAQVDEDMLTSHYIVFSKGEYRSYTASNKRYVHEGVITHSSSSDFTLDEQSRYSIDLGTLILSRRSCKISIKDDILTLDNNKYVKISGLDPSRFFSISLPEGNAVKQGYAEGTVSIPVMVENESPKYKLSASTTVSWIKNIKHSDGRLSFTIDKTTANRKGTIELSYFDAESVTIDVTQAVDRFIVINTTPINLNYRSQTYSIPYSIENPIKDALPTVTSTDSWIKDITVSATSISFDVSENPLTSSRNCILKFEYEEANPVQVNIVQSAAITDMAVASNSISTDYKGKNLTFGYSVSNPRDGLTLNVLTVNDWISVISTDNNIVKFGVSENSSGGARMGSITVSYGNIARTVNINQSYTEPEIQIDDIAVGFTGTTVNTALSIGNARTGGQITATSSEEWLSDLAVSANTLSFKAGANNTGKDRKAVITLVYKVGALTLATKRIAVTQAEAVLTVDKDKLSFSHTAGTQTFAISSNCDWAIISSASWLTVSPATSSGAKSVNVTASANTSGVDRTATLTVKNDTFGASKTIPVSQAAPFIQLSETNLTTNYGTEAMEVVVDANVAWTVSASPWISVSPSSGSGKKTIKVTPTKNENLQPRTGSITVTSSAYNVSRTVTVTQKAFSASWTLEGGTTWSANTPAASSTQRVIRTNFPVTVSSSEPWLTASHSVIQQGETTLTINVANNTTGNSREAKLTLSNDAYTTPKIITISQIAASLTSSADTWNPTADGGTTSINITSNISWTASSNASWLTLDKASGPSGTTSLSLTAAANKAVSTRNAIITITNPTFNETRTVSVTQAAFSPVLSVSTSSWAPTADAQTSSSFTITSNASWTVSSNASWLTASKSSGTGNDSITLSVSSNTSSSQSRTGTITVTTIDYSLSKTITVTQAKVNPTITVSTSSWAPDFTAQSSSSITVSSGVNWTASSSSSWLTVSKTSGLSGSSSLVLSVTNNNSTSSRTANITITNTTFGVSKTISVTQYGYTQCAISLSNNAIDLGVPIDRTGTYTFVIKGWTSNGSTLLGIQSSSDSNDWRFFKSGSTYYFDWGSSRISYYYSTSITGSYRKFVFSNYAMKYYSNESTTSTTWTKTGTTQSTIPSSTATIRVGSSSESLTFKSLKVQNSGGTTTHNFIGVKSNDKVGIFDTITGTFIAGGSYVSL